MQNTISTSKSYGSCGGRSSVSSSPSYAGHKLMRLVVKTGYDRNPPPPSASTYSIPRRVMYILKRATVKFPSDLAVWLAYVEYASHQRMRKVVVRGLTT